MEMGAMVETLETSHTWSRLGELHARGRRRRSATRWPGRARRGSSSATSRTPMPTAPRSTSPSSPAPAPAPSSSSGGRSKRAASEAIVACGATITHHHAVGRDHVPYMEAEVGATGHRGPARGQGTARPGGDHEPRKAPPGRLAIRRLGFAGFAAPTMGPVTVPRRTSVPV